MYENEYEVIDVDVEGQKPKKCKKKRGRKIFVIVLIAIVLISATVAGILLAKGDIKITVKGKDNVDNTSASLEIGESKEYNSTNADGTLTSVQIAEKVKPSVMAVLVYKNGQKSGEGSGIFMSVDSTNTYTYVLTCAHIVSSSGVSVKIQLEDETQYDADIIGYDTRTDVAVLRVKATGFTVAEFGDSSVLKVGEPVYAIGNPGGTEFYGSFTGGYVSAIDRPTSTSSSGYTMECIQHDAAINPGNSGGALVNSYGQVIGMNSSKIADEDYEGMGFAIPINVAKDVVADILETGYVQDRAKLGISYVEVSSNQTYSMIVKVNNLPTGSIIIATIDSDGALAGTDVVAGDLIIAANGKDLTTADVLLDIIEDAKPGDSLQLTIAHINQDYSIKKFDVTVKLVEDTGSSVETTTEQSEGSFVNPYAGK